MTKIQLPPVLRRWRFLAAVMGVTALAGGGVLLAANNSDPATASAFHPVSTVRVLDTRPETQIGTRGTPLGLADSYNLVIPNLPDDATAVNLNVTVVDGTSGSFLTVYPTGDTRPIASTINWDSEGAVANSATVNLHSNHSVTLYNLKGTVNVVIDVLGYYAPSPVSTGNAAPAVFVSANNTTVEGIPVGQSLTFDSVVSTQGGITAFGLPGSAVAFGVPTDGLYQVSFSASAVEASQFDIQVNNAAAGAVALKFSAGANQTNSGTAVLTLLADDVITIDSLTSVGQVNLDTTVGGAINASITINKIG